VTERSPAPGRDVSVIIPVSERFGDLAGLYAEFSAELRRLGRSFEFVFVVDGGQRACVPLLKDLKAREGDAVRIVVFGRSFGEAAALAVGIDRASGEVLVTLAAYFQVGPEGMREALRMLDDRSADIVVGRRHPRADALLNRLQSRVFHWLVGRLTRTRFKDISCGLRAMGRETASELTLYGDLHRFIPILAQNRGFTVREIDLPQRREDLALRYPGMGAYPRRLLDLLTVFFLIKFTRKPLRFFGLIGSAALAVGGSITVYLGVYRILGLGGIADRPLLLLGVLLMVLGVQSISIGLLGEIIIFTHARRVSEYRIAEIL
jgi:glycosyltransferase involved in cell wall biosynthesis